MTDSEASISVLGVYRVPLNEDELRDDLRRLYFADSAMRDTSHTIHEFIDTCVPLVLFEILLANLDQRFDIADITQEMPGEPRSWQAPYDEALLLPDGSGVIARDSVCTRGLQAGRITFYFHFYNPLKLMRWSYGEFSSPEVQFVPERLWNLVRYFPV